MKDRLYEMALESKSQTLYPYFDRSDNNHDNLRFISNDYFTHGKGVCFAAGELAVYLEDHPTSKEAFNDLTPMGAARTLTRVLLKLIPTMTEVCRDSFLLELSGGSDVNSTNMFVLAPEVLVTEIDSLILRGMRIQAIKKFREEFAPQMGLVEVKRAIDSRVDFLLEQGAQILRDHYDTNAHVEIHNGMIQVMESKGGKCYSIHLGDWQTDIELRWLARTKAHDRFVAEQFTQ